MDFTKTYHLDTYSTLSPKRPELSQAGRTILVTGGASGVGIAISRAFVQAGAARLIVVGRRKAVLEEAKTELLTLGSTEILTYPCDICDDAGVRALWEDLKAKHISVDVLVLNAAIANTTPEGLGEKDLLAKVRSTFEMNVFSNVGMVDPFLKQGPPKGKAIVCLNASTVQISPIRIASLAYAPSKTAFGSIMQDVADLLNPEDVQVISYHPGSILTDAVKKSKWANIPLAWNTETLPGDYAVWAASSEARFLHGRLVWCNWDVEELKNMDGFKHPGFCRVGLQGPTPLSEQELWTQMGERAKMS